MVDNVDDAFALGFLAVGVKDWNKATDADFKKAAAFLRDVHKNVRTYHADGAEGSELMKSGEILLDGQSLLEMEADERARSGLFLAFQYPLTTAAKKDR